MRTGTDRNLPGYPDGTRHPCPFCSWYLDAESVLAYLEDQPHEFVLDAVSQRLDSIHRRVRDHMITEHPQDFRETTRLQVDIIS